MKKYIYEVTFKVTVEASNNDAASDIVSHVEVERETGSFPYVDRSFSAESITLTEQGWVYG